MSYYDTYGKSYSFIMENTSPDENTVEIIKEDDKLNFLRFKTCLQSFGIRNRNKRLWKWETVNDMIEAPHIKELLLKGGLPGENGHPVSSSGPVTFERIGSIDPNNICFLIKSFEWSLDKRFLYGIIDTLDDCGGPGSRFKNHIKQGLLPSFSARSIVGQRKYPNGNIDVFGNGRLICYDRVILPSHEEAYIDESIPIKNIVKNQNYETVLESAMEPIISYLLELPENYAVLDGLNPSLESARITSDGELTVAVEGGHVIIPQRKSFTSEIKNFMKQL